jgi:DNA-binding response OmpR family regulator
LAKTSVKVTGQRILVVDDNVDAASSLAALLGLYGAEVMVAPDGKAALDEFARLQPDAVVLDIGLPGMDGYAVAREMRRSAKGTPARIVALTGWGQESDRQRARDAGIDHHLTKPADIEALCSLLQLDG